MRAGSNSQAGKAVVDSSLDLAGLGYFYFPEREGEVEGGECACVGCAQILLQMSDNDRWPGATETQTHMCTYSNSHIHKHSWEGPMWHPEKRLITLRLISLRKTRCGGKKGAKEEKKEEEWARGSKEGVKDRGSEDGWGWRRWWGDYTIIQITAGNNLVADVSRSTMPTTHRLACVCALTEFQCSASSQRVEEKKKTAASEAPEATQAHSSHNLPGKVFLFFSLILNRSSVQMKQPIKITRGSIVIG